MSRFRDALFHLENETDIGYRWEDAEFYRTGRITKRYPDLRPAIKEMLGLLNEALRPQKNAPPERNYSPPNGKYGPKY